MKNNEVLACGKSKLQEVIKILLTPLKSNTRVYSNPVSHYVSWHDSYRIPI